MDSTQAIYDGLKDAEIDFIVSVPCVNLSKLLNMIDDDPQQFSCRIQVSVTPLML